MVKQDINNDNKVNKKKITVIFRICFIIFVSVMWIILQSFLENDNSAEYYIIIVFFIAFIVFMVFFLISGIILFVLKIPSKSISIVKQEEQCQHFNMICCVNLAIESLKSAYRIRLDDNVAIKYGLYSEEQVIEKESSINQGEVWIVSYDLTAEALENQHARIREMNIKKGIKYRLFYISDYKQKYGELQDNIQKLDDRYNKKIKLYPYEKPISIFTFLFSLFGILMITDEYGMVKESFFALYSSNDKIKEPIYLKMSYCMERKYNQILRSIKNTARNPREKQLNNRVSIVEKKMKNTFKLFKLHKR